jgi:hypothetical protein
MSTLSARTPRPFLPDIRRDKPGSAIGKAALIAARHQFRYGDGDNSLSLEQLAAKTYPDDRLVPSLISKAAVSPASTTDTGWAAELRDTRCNGSSVVALMCPASVFCTTH